MRACNRESGFEEDVRCGEPSAAVSGTPFGPLTPPDVSAELVGDNDQQVKVTWEFPDGNGREIASQTVTLSGAVSDKLDPKSKTWTSKALGLGKKVTVTVSYCVQDGTCSETVTRDATTPASLPLATVAVGALTGTCGTNRQLDGEWRHRQGGLRQRDLGAGAAAGRGDVPGHRHRVPVGAGRDHAPTTAGTDRSIMPGTASPPSRPPTSTSLSAE